MSGSRKSRATIGALALTLAFASTARAGGHDAAAAETLFRDGREAMKRGDFATACPKLAESQRLDPAPGTLLNLADCESKWGRTASAWEHATAAIEQLPAGDDRLPIAKKLAADLDKRAPRLTVRLADDAPKGTTVLRDDVELGRASLGTKLPVDPGDHTIVVKAPGREASRLSVTVAEGDDKSIVLAVGRAQAATTGGGAAGADQASNMRTVGYVVGGAGLLGVGIGTVVALMGRSAASDASDRVAAARAATPRADDASAVSDYNAAAGQAKTGWIVAGVGGAVLITGIVLVASAPNDAPKSAVRVAPWMDASSGGVAVAGHW